LNFTLCVSHSFHRRFSISFFENSLGLVPVGLRISCCIPHHTPNITCNTPFSVGTRPSPPQHLACCIRITTLCLDPFSISRRSTPHSHVLPNQSGSGRPILHSVAYTGPPLVSSAAANAYLKRHQPRAPRATHLSDPFSSPSICNPHPPWARPISTTTTTTPRTGLRFLYQTT
jgi:hypothetical protein